MMLERDEVNNVFVQKYYDAVITNLQESGAPAPRIERAPVAQYDRGTYLVYSDLGAIGQSTAIFEPGKRVRVMMLVRNIGKMRDELVPRLAAEYPLVRVNPSRDGKSAATSVFSIFEAKEDDPAIVDIIISELMRLHVDLAEVSNTIRMCC